MKSRTKIKNGFTLMELLVIIAIIGLLSSTILVAMSSARTKARNSKRKADIKQLIIALELYADKNGELYPAGTPPANGNNGNGNGNGNGNNGNNNGNGNGNGNGNNSTLCSGMTSENNSVDIQCLSDYLVPTYIGAVPNDPLQSYGTNYQYIWRTAANGRKEYGILIPFGNESGGSNCQYQTTGGASNWFNSTPICSY